MGIAAGPYVPTIDTHYGIIEIDGCFACQMGIEADPYIDQGVDQSDWIDPN